MVAPLRTRITCAVLLVALAVACVLFVVFLFRDLAGW